LKIISIFDVCKFRYLVIAVDICQGDQVQFWWCCW